MLSLLPATATTALKEWAVAVDAMAGHKQILVLRKGGIHREDKEFRILHNEFVLYPTYEHQKAELVKDEYHDAIERTLAENDVPGLVTVSYWCEVTEVFETRRQEVVDSVSPFHIWTSDYALKRLHWRPKQPLTLALLRVYRLQQPQALPVLDAYAGCKSWVDLGQEVPLGKMWPVLTDDEYEQRAKVIRDALAAAGSEESPHAGPAGEAVG